MRKGLGILVFLACCSISTTAYAEGLSYCGDVIKFSNLELQALLEGKEINEGVIDVCIRDEENQCALLSLIFLKHGAFIAPPKMDVCAFIPRERIEPLSASSF